MRDRRGFTLIELMIVVSIIGILGSVATSKAQEVLRRSQEARTKGNLAVLRTSIGVYMANTGGTYPSVLEDLTTDALPVLERIPLKLTPPYHPEGNSVSNGNLAGQSASRGDWYYFNDPRDAEHGTVVVNCTHSDLHGKSWATY